MKLWHSYQELFELTRRELFTAVVGDIMDTLGLQNQFLPPQIRPLRDDMVVIGQAMTVLEADVFSAQVENSANPLMTKPFGLMFEALDDLKAGEVYICTGGSPTYALWGELMSVRAKQLGAAGAVLDGYSRDTNGILNLNFPTFSFGAYAQDQGPRGKVIDFRVPLEISGVKINPGDIVFGDIDGVCIIPQHMADEVFAKSIEKARGEKLVRKAIESGLSASAAFKKYGIM
jgi:regulator of RNase E activity RraA